MGGRNYACVQAQVTVQGPGTITMPPGLTLIVDKALFLVDHTNITGADVSFFFKRGGGIRIDAPNSSVQLTADASGMLFRSARASASADPVMFNVGPGSDLRGVIYFPNSPVVFGASGSVSSCLQIIGRTVELMGTWQITGPCAMPGVSPIVASRDVDLTQ